jgi:uncharacterized membrane protein
MWRRPPSAVRFSPQSHGATERIEENERHGFRRAFSFAWEHQSVVIPSAVLSREESASRLHRFSDKEITREKAKAGDVGAEDLLALHQ